MLEAVSTYTIHYQNDVWDDRPLVDPCACQHAKGMGLPIDLKIERRQRGGSEIVVAAIICMDCGSDTTGQMDLIDGLTEAFREGMSKCARVVVERVYDLVEHRRLDLEGQFIPTWMAIPLGLTTAQINEYRQAARVRRAADYMGERVARYAVAST